MPMIVRCRLCGTDHPYREDIDQMDCRECDTPLDSENARDIWVPRVTTQADPLEGM